MSDHILFLTGKLAENRLRKVLEELQPSAFSHEVMNLGLSVAALMTAGMITRRLKAPVDAQRIIVPGLCRGDLDSVAGALGVPVDRGPDDLKDLPVFFGREAKPVDLGRHDVLIFAEIVEAPALDVSQIINRARDFVRDGADVIDLGCLPDTPFPHLESSIAALKKEGFQVSVDTLYPDDLLRGGRAGADYLLSLTEQTLGIADEVASVPVLIPTEHAEMDSLYRAIETMQKKGRRFIADSVLDPIHFGFADSLQRYAALRARFPSIEIMMGVGNLTELTEADTSGINAVLFGLISEMHINSVLLTQVSPHARSVIREADRARRIMYAAREEQRLPKGLDSGLLFTHERKPFPWTFTEVEELARQIRDPSYRVEVTDEGIHVFNRDGLVSGTDIFALFPQLRQLDGDAPHAFYMGVELAKAQLAWLLGKHYVQDQPLNWGVAVPQDALGEPLNPLHARGPVSDYPEEGETLKVSRAARRGKKKQT